MLAEPFAYYWFVLVAIGLVSGCLSGLLGVGGGMLMVPLLSFLLGLEQHKAQGISLGVMIFPVMLLGFISYYKKGYVRFSYIFRILIGFLLGGLLGAQTAHQVSAFYLRKLFGLLLIIVAVKALLQKPEK